MRENLSKRGFPNYPKGKSHYPMHFGAIRDTAIENNPGLMLNGTFRPYLMEGEQLVVFRRSEGSVFFFATTKVESVEELGTASSPYQSVSLSGLKPFDRERELSVLAGSLAKVYRFLYPERHFRRAYVRLSPEDYRTIVEDAVDLDRSVFRYLFEALPWGLRAHFVSTCLDSDTFSSDGRVKDYRQISRALLDYLDGPFLQFAKLLTSMSQQFNELQGIRNLPALSKLTVSDGEQGSIELGQVVPRLREIAASRLFSETTFGPALIEEAREKLESPTGTENTASYHRTWNETIF